MAFALLFALLYGQFAALHAAPPERDPPRPYSATARSSQLGKTVEAYRMCARLNLPPDFWRVRDSAAAAAVALENCQKQRFIVAGQFALDNPGTTQTRAFVDNLSSQLVAELSQWLEDVDARRISPHPPAVRGK